MAKETIVGAFRKLKVGQQRDFPFTNFSGIRAEAVRQNREARLLNKIVDNEVAYSVSSKKKHDGFCTVTRVK